MSNFWRETFLFKQSFRTSKIESSKLFTLTSIYFRVQFELLRYSPIAIADSFPRQLLDRSNLINPVFAQRSLKILVPLWSSKLLSLMSSSYKEELVFKAYPKYEIPSYPILLSEMFRLMIWSFLRRSLESLLAPSSEIRLWEKSISISDVL